MNLAVLLSDLVTLKSHQAVLISGLVADSRRIQPGDLFCAYPGHAYDARDDIPKAIAQGVAAILYESNGYDAEAFNDAPIPVIGIADLATHLSHIAAKFYHFPARSLKVIGVTGTNGKTSVCHYLAQALCRIGVPCAVMGTVGNGFLGQLSPAALTTPDPIAVQAGLHHLHQQGAEAVAMEVSSHSLIQHRVAAVSFYATVFTNLTQDHLDYHGTLEAYIAAKSLLFQAHQQTYAIFNVDDPVGRQFSRRVQDATVIRYGVENASEAEICLLEPQWGAGGIDVMLHLNGDDQRLHSTLMGTFNLSNMAAVAAVLSTFSMTLSDIATELSQLKPVIGRMQRIHVPNKPLAIIDYAHTPDALEKALQSLKAQCQGQLWCVFGCGGDRDRSKRPKMAQIAEHLADRVILTNDNPRTEPPEQIIADMMQGLVHPQRVGVMLDRASAIEQALTEAQTGDLVLIAGKGHERVQILGVQQLPFSDADCATAILNRGSQ